MKLSKNNYKNHVPMSDQKIIFNLLDDIEQINLPKQLEIHINKRKKENNIFAEYNIKWSKIKDCINMGLNIYDLDNHLFTLFSAFEQIRTK